ncbi:MAG: TonB-dependent receptor [Cyclobacteriaceae bacterium]|jgi:TonB-linked SusC/RagA family outer membrane protein
MKFCILCYNRESLKRVFGYTFLQLLLATVIFMHAQGKPPRVDLKVSNTTLKEIFQRLEAKTPYQFTYGAEVTNDQRTYSLEFTDLALPDLVHRLAGRVGLDYRIKGKKISIEVDKPSEVITGKVIDDRSGEPLVGATVLVKDTNSGTVTDIEGKFSINADPEDTLVVSYIGYTTQEIPASSPSINSIALLEDAQQLDDIVVVGYGTQKKSEVTSSISQIEGEAIRTTNASNVAMSLQGRASGVELLGSGTPGATPNFRIRGVGTINNSEPLIVLDGVPVDREIFAQLSSSEIESIEILKDAASAAIYGTRAANGVVIVTTNNASFNQPTRVRLNASAGVNSVIKKFPVLDAGHLWELKRERYLNEGISIPDNSPWADEYYNVQRTDWQDEVFQAGLFQDYNLNVSSGSEKSTVNLDIFHRNEEGTIINTYLKRTGFSLKASQKVSDRLRFRESVRYSGVNRRLTQNDGNNGTSAHVYSTYLYHPSIPVYNEDGSYGSGQVSTEFGDMWNPVYKAREEWQKHFDTNALITFNADYDLTDALMLTARGSYQKTDSRFERFQNITPNQSRTINAPYIQDHRSASTTIVGELFANYNQTFGEHTIGVTLGGSAQEETGSYLNIMGEGFATVDPNQLVIDNASTIYNDGSNEYDPIGITSGFLRTTYNFRDTYYFSGIFRADASSRFAEGNKWGYFPSLSVGWRISNEPFFRENDLLSNLKLNASWGQLGNQNIAPFQYLSTYTKDQNYNYILGGELYTGSHLSAFANPAVTWETTETLNILLEMALLDYRLGVNLAYYNRITSDMFVPYPKVGNTGLVGEPYRNLGEVVNNGVEVELNYTDDIDKFTYNIGINASFQKNELVKINGLTEYFDYGINRTYEGQSLASFYGYRTDGIYQNQSEIDNDPNLLEDARRSDIMPGDVRFVDTNGDNRVTPEDRTTIGDPNPDVLLGLNLGLTYGQWNLSATFSGAFGHQLYDVTMDRNYSPNESENMHATAWQRWTEAGSTNQWPRMTYIDANDNYRVSDLFVKDGDYVRLKDLNLGYTLPAQLISALRIESLRVYLSGRNLLTFTSFDGVDPEESGNTNNLARGQIWSNYPQSKTMVVGLDISF